MELMAACGVFPKGAVHVMLLHNVHFRPKASFQDAGWLMDGENPGHRGHPLGIKVHRFPLLPTCDESRLP